MVVQPARLVQVVDDLRAGVSQPRLDRYRPPGGSDLEMVVNYLWNIALSEALYPGLAALEVTLRSRIHAELTAREGTDMWFRRLLEPGQLRDYGNAHVKLREKHKSALTAGHIVAELSFGFWTTLLSQPYHQALWAPNRSALLHAVFPQLPSTHNARQVIHQHYNGLRLLRNRVMHHEPIWLGAKLPGRNLVPQPVLHAEIFEAIGWVSATVKTSIGVVDRFDAVFNGKAQLEADLRAQLRI